MVKEILLKNDDAKVWAGQREGLSKASQSLSNLSQGVGTSVFTRVFRKYREDSAPNYIPFFVDFLACIIQFEDAPRKSAKNNLQ
jgi:hypothetical protein